MATLQSLIAQAKQAGISLPPGIGQLPGVSAAAKFSGNLYLGAKGNDVSTLQLFLIGQNKGVFAEQLGANGATGYFGSLTKKALQEYQQSVGITPATGGLGPKTRTYINSLTH